jgi:hypothetical protein
LQLAMGPKKFPVEQARLLLRQRSRLMVGLPTHEIVNTLAAAMSALTGFPNVTALAEPVPVAASGTWANVTPSGVDLVDMLSCENYGSITMLD